MNPTETTPPTTTDAAAVRMATFRLARRLRAQRADATLSDAHFAVLAALYTHGAHTLGELAERERVSPPSMNRSVNCLEEAGFVVREPDATDRRKVNISVTAAGSGIVTETVHRRDAWLDEALCELTDDERDLLLRATAVMRKVADR